MHLEREQALCAQVWGVVLVYGVKCFVFGGCAMSLERSSMIYVPIMLLVNVERASGFMSRAPPGWL